MKTAVSIPDEVFHDADRVAARLGLNRSQLYARAIEDFVARQDQDPVTQALDALADELEQVPSPAVGRSLIDSGAWEW